MKRLFFVCLIIAVASVFAQADTLSDLRSKVRYLANDNGPTDSIRYSDTEIDYWLNEGRGRALKLIGHLRHRYSITTVEDTVEYELPSTFLEEIAAYIVNADSTSTYKRLAWTSIDKLDAEYSNWEDRSSGTPSEYYIRVTTFNTVIGLPIPPDSSHAGTDYLRIDYVYQMPDMTTSTDEAFNGLPYLDVYSDILVNYAVYRCLKDETFYQLFKIGLEELKADINTNTDKVGKIRVIR